MQRTQSPYAQGPWPFAVITIDLNGLKAINDEQGHAAGDAMLRRAGEVLAKAVDAPACAARVGGDEFAVLLPGQTSEAPQPYVTGFSRWWS